MNLERPHSSERGAIIIHVAIALLALIAFSAFIVDYGIMWVARTQAQAAADAGALAGAVTLARGNPMDPDIIAESEQAAIDFAGRTAIWGQATAPADIRVGAGLPCPGSAGGAQGCIHVDVVRGVPDRVGNVHTNTLPTFFARFVGITSQGVRATARAQAAAGNATNCLKPWLIPDRWIDTNKNGIYDAGDVYDAPGDYPGSGYTIADIGTSLTLKESTPSYLDPISPSDFYAIEDAQTYKDAITGCQIMAQIGDTVTALPGNRQDPTVQATQDLIDSDPGYWDSTAQRVVNSNGKRIVAIGLFNPQLFSSGRTYLTIVNILGFFITGVNMSTGEVSGVIVSDPGLLIAGAGTVGPTSAFVRVVRLVK